MKYENLKEYKM